MLDRLVERSVAVDVKMLLGRYVPTRKNAMVANHCAQLGFTLVGHEADGSAVSTLELAGDKRRNRHICVLELVPAGD